MSGHPENLYISALSPFGARLRLVAALTGRDLACISPPPGGTGSAEMKAINPFGQVPTLVVDGVVLIESLALMEYFLETGRHSTLLPDVPLTRARVRGIARAHDNQVVAAMLPIFGQLRNPAPDDAVIEAAFRQVELKLTALATLFDSSGFMVGNSLTLADLAVVPFANLMGVFAARFSQVSPYARIVRLADWWQVVMTVPEIAVEVARLQDALKKAFG